jgi:hypothetical protein
VKLGHGLGLGLAFSDPDKLLTMAQENRQSISRCFPDPIHNLRAAVYSGDQEVSWLIQ